MAIKGSLRRSLTFKARWSNRLPAALVLTFFFFLLLFLFPFPLPFQFFFRWMPTKFESYNKSIIAFLWVGQCRGIFSSRVIYCPSLRSGQYCHPQTEHSPVLPSQSCNLFQKIFQRQIQGYRALNFEFDSLIIGCCILVIHCKSTDTFFFFQFPKLLVMHTLVKEQGTFCFIMWPVE